MEWWQWARVAIAILLERGKGFKKRKSPVSLGLEVEKLQ